MAWMRVVPFGLLIVAIAAPHAARGDERRIDLEGIKAENEHLRKELAAQDVRVRQLQRDLDEARGALVQSKFQIEALEHRCQKLQDDLLRSGKEVSVSPDGDLGKPDPAAKGKAKIAQGKITGLSKDGNLLQISLGVEAGVKEGQTLEVFRLAVKNKQRSLYLGTLTLIRVDPQAALGQFKSVTGFDYRPSVGDDVSSALSAK